MPLELLHKNSVADLEALHEAHLGKEEKQSDDDGLVVVAANPKKLLASPNKERKAANDLNPHGWMNNPVSTGGGGGSLFKGHYQHMQHSNNKEPSSTQYVPSEFMYQPNPKRGDGDDDSKSAFSEDEVFSVDTAATPPQRVLDYEMPSDSYAKKGYKGKKGPLHEMVTKQKKKKDFIQSFVENMPWKTEQQRQMEGQNVRQKDDEWQSVLVPEMTQPQQDNNPSSNSTYPTNNDYPSPGRRPILTAPSPMLATGLKKGILKGSARNAQSGRNRLNSDSDASSVVSSFSATSSCVSRDSQGRPRRKLFPSVAWYSEVPLSSQKKEVKTVAFEPQARLYLGNGASIAEEWENEDVWWQPSDFDGFREVGDLVATAAEEGGTAAWLGNEPEPLDDSDPDQWWGAFGHSARGLEHVICEEEGQMRLEQVEHCIHVVLQEQERQKTQTQNQNKQSGGSQTNDAKQLRVVSVTATQKSRNEATNRGLNDSIQASMQNNISAWEYQQWKLYREQRKQFHREERERKAATSIQAAQRQRTALRRYAHQQVAVASLQSYARCVLAVRQFRLAKAQAERNRAFAATRIQAVVRRYNARKNYVVEKAAVVSVQSFGRAIVATRCGHKRKREKMALIRLQAWIRMLQAKGRSSTGHVTNDTENGKAALTPSTSLSTMDSVSPSSGDESQKSPAAGSPQAVDPILRNLERNLAVQRLHPEDLFLVPVNEEENENDKDESLQGGRNGCVKEEAEVPKLPLSENKTSRAILFYAIPFLFVVVAAAISQVVPIYAPPAQSSLLTEDGPVGDERTINKAEGYELLSEGRNESELNSLEISSVGHVEVEAGDQCYVSAEDNPGPGTEPVSFPDAKEVEGTNQRYHTMRWRRLHRRQRKD